MEQGQASSAGERSQHSQAQLRCPRRGEDALWSGDRSEERRKSVALAAGGTSAVHNLGGDADQSGMANLRAPLILLAHQAR